MKKAYFLAKDFKDLQKHREKLDLDLKEVGRAMGESTESGETWHDNAVFDANQEQFGKVSNQIREVDTLISNAQIFTPSANTDYVGLGLCVKLKEKGTEKVQYYYMGSSWMKPLEEKPDGTTIETAFRITLDSVFARGIKSKKVGEEAIIDLPVGKRTYIIEEIILDKTKFE